MARNRKAFCSEQLDRSLRPISSYEKERCINIENKAKKLQEIGLSKLVHQLRMKNSNEIKGKEKLKRNSKIKIIYLLKIVKTLCLLIWMKKLSKGVI